MATIKECECIKITARVKIWASILRRISANCE